MKPATLHFTLAASLGLAALISTTESYAAGPYQPSEESLAAHEAAPDWFRDEIWWPDPKVLRIIC